MRGKSYFFILWGVCFLSLNIYALNPESFEWRLKVSVGKADIRLEPNAESPVLTTVEKGLALESYEKIGEWFRVVAGPDEKGVVVKIFFGTITSFFKGH